MTENGEVKVSYTDISDDRESDFAKKATHHEEKHLRQTPGIPA